MPRKPPNPAEIFELADQLARIDDRQARALAEHWLDNRVAAKARARVLDPETPAVADLLAALEHLAQRFPVDRQTLIGRRAYRAASDLLIATHGRTRLTPAQRLTLSLAAVHALDFA